MDDAGGETPAVVGGKPDARPGLNERPIVETGWRCCHSGGFDHHDVFGQSPVAIH
jgi:hypothetical protein